MSLNGGGLWFGNLAFERFLSCHDQESVPSQLGGFCFPVLPPIDGGKRHAKTLCQSDLGQAHSGAKSFYLFCAVLGRSWIHARDS